MDLVLGLSMTSAAVRWVLVEGSTGEGATIDHEVLDIAVVRTASSASARELVEEVFGTALLDAARSDRLTAIGVTWTPEVAVEASIVLEALAAEGFLEAVPVWEEEAATALATGMKDLAHFDDIALCIIEPDSTLIAAATPSGVLVDRVDQASGDPVGLTHRIIAKLDVDGWMPEVIYTVGSSDDLDVVVRLLRDAAPMIPVISAAESGLALARGAALASAQTSGIDAWDALTPARDAFAVDFGRSTSRKRRPLLAGRSVALTSILVAAALTFVVSLSIAVSLRLIPGSDEPDQQALAEAIAAPAAQPDLPEAQPQTPAARPQPPVARPSVPEAPSSQPAAPPPVVEAVVEDVAEAAPVEPPPVYGPVEPAPAAPAPVPAGVYQPPPPDYVPPPVVPQPPSYIPPVDGVAQPPPQQPRLRDRIIERIPIINRFHEPQYPTTP